MTNIKDLKPIGCMSEDEVILGPSKSHIWYNVLIAQRKNGHYHYMRVVAYNTWGEPVCKWKQKSWK